MAGARAAGVEVLTPQRQLVAEMRRIKDASGLSYGRLADKTHYSRSSWERFLNGKQLPTRIAVEQLALAVGEDPARLLDLWDGIGDSGPEPEREAEPQSDTYGTEEEGSATAGQRRGGRRHRIVSLSYLAGGAVLGSLITAVVSGAHGSPAVKGQPLPTDQVPAGAVSTSRAIKPGCSGDSCLHREPQAMDCQWDATTVRQTWLRGLQIQLRYSPSCKAVWGRVENGTVGDKVSITDRFGSSEEAQTRVGTDTYTRMLSVADAPATTVSICGAIPSQHDQECSPDRPAQP